MVRYNYDGHGTFMSKKSAMAIVQPVIRDVANLLKDEKLPEFAWSQENLTAWMMRQQMGSKDFGETTLWPGQSVAQVVNNWWRSIKGNRFPADVRRVSGGSEFLWDMERSFLEKVGPIGGFLPASIDMPRKMNDLLTESKIDQNCNLRALDQAIDCVRRMVPSHSIHSLSVEVAVHGNGKGEGLDGTTNGCIPVVVGGWGRKGDPNRAKQDERDSAYRYILNETHRVVDESHRAKNYRDIRLPMIGIQGIRVNEPKGPDPLNDEKYTRPVIAMPKAFDTCPGATVQQPIEEALSKVYWPATGLPLMLAHLDGAHVDKGVEMLMEYADAHGLKVLSIDYSHFDRSVPPRLRRMVDDAMMEWMDKPTALLFKAIEEGNISGTYIVTPYKLYEPTPHGVNSGSIFTNLIDSMVNLAVLLYGHFAGYYQLLSCHPQGDDNIAVGVNLNPVTMSQAGKDLGFEINPEKEHYDLVTAEYLKRYYVYGRVGGIYPTNRACTKAKVSEDDIGKFVRNASIEWQQTFKAIAKAGNVVYHPFFEQYVKYCKAGDPLHLGADYPPSYVKRMAGDYALKYEREVLLKPYIRTGEGMSWDDSLVNGVIRGEKVPTDDKALFRRVTGRRYEDITYDDLRYPIRLAAA